MKELLEEIKMLYKYFNNENYIFFVLFLISIIYIFSTEKNKKIKDFFVFYSAIILIIIWNPICIYILNKFINIGSMYRIYYMLPNCITISYALTKIIEKNDKLVKKMVALIGIALVIICYGTCIFNEYSTTKVSNYYKLPDETVQIAYMISGDKETEHKKAIVPYGMSSQIRQVCGNIKLYYSRIVTNPKDENGNSLPHDTDDASNYEPVQKLNSGDAKYIANLCKNSNTNYVVFSKSTTLAEKIEEYGFEQYGETENYVIYRLVD
ncbi:MAG: hypothetical protein ACI4UE_04685 [Candidatus Scatovivens sp.]